MGLEAIELIIKIEESFKICISDAEAEKISTVGELYACLIGQIERFNLLPCCTASRFNLIRKLLMTNYQIYRADIKLSSILIDLIPQTERQNFWRIIQSNSSVKLPRLKRSSIFQLKRDRFPQHILNIGDLARECCKYSLISDEFKLRDKQNVWMEVGKLVCEVADCELEDIKPETNFTYDLGF